MAPSLYHTVTIKQCYQYYFAINTVHCKSKAMQNYGTDYSDIISPNKIRDKSLKNHNFQ